MQNSTIEKEACEKCGVDVRENTQFCYNCGNPRNSGEFIVESGSHTGPEAPPADEPLDREANGNISDPGTKAALDDLAAKFNSDEADADKKLALAAEQRRKARVVRRNPREYKWEPADDMAPTRILVAAVLVAVIAGIVVLITVLWR
jgi:hypothetical protein